jgi:formate/nitrite transporter FocA (FNT family)
MLDFVLRSLKAGLMIGVGCIAYTVVGNHYVGSFLFALGLFYVIMSGYFLFTGRIGGLKIEEIFGIKDIYFNTTSPISLILMLVINLVGIWCMCSCFSLFSGIDMSFASTLASNKIAESLPECFVRSIGCGMMMYVAVSGYKANNHPLTVIMPVMAFILCGFEHCIANFGYMAMAGMYSFKHILVMVLGNAVGSLILSKPVIGK